MDLFKILGTFAIKGADQAKEDIDDVADAAKSTSDTVRKSSQTTEKSNESAGGSFAKLKAKVNEYKAQGMTTSAAWKQANADMKKSTEDAGNGMTGTFKKIGAAVATYLTVDAIKNFGLACIEASAESNATASQFSQTFGDFEGAAKKSLSGIAGTTGVAENRMKGSFTKIAAFAKTTGMDTEGALSLADRAMLAVADSAAYYDRSLEETTESLQSFLKGNYENDAALGLSATETTRNAAANKLYGKSFNDLSESQKQLTLLQMVEDANKLSGAMGQAARESDTWTNQTGNLKQAWTDFKAVVGGKFLEPATNAVKKLADVVQTMTDKFPAAVEWVEKHKTALQITAGIVGTLAVAIGAYTAAEALKNIAVAAGVAAEGSATVAMGAHVIATNIATAATSAFGAVMAFVTSPITLVVLAIGALVGIFILLWNKCDGFRNFFLNMWDVIKTKWSEVRPYFEAMWQGIKTAFSISLDFIVAKFKIAWEIIKLAWSVAVDWFGVIWTGIKGAVSTLTTFISGAFKTAWSVIKLVWSVVSGYFKAIWNTIKGIFSVVKSVLSGDFQGAWDAIKRIVGVWASYFSNVWSKIKGVFSSVKSWFSSTFSAAWNAVKNVFSGVSSFFSNTLGKIKSTFSKVTEIIREPFAKGLEKVKSLFSSLKLSFPKIKLPHFKVSGSLSLSPPSVPKISIDWYAKGGIMTKPTLFDYNPMTGRAKVGGEAGNEAIAPISTLQQYVKAAVRDENDVITLKLDRIIELLVRFFPEMLTAFKEMAIVLDDGTLVGRLAPAMNTELGRLAAKGKRGRA